VDGEVTCFAIYNGELYVGGQFNNPGGLSSIGLMKWNGISFDTLPGNYLFGNSRVEAMAVYNNELYIGGGFTTYNTFNPSVFDFIAKWDGANFTSVGTGCNNEVYSMAVYKGNLYVGGDMQTAGSTVVNSIAKWNGIQWLSVGGGITGSSARVSELEVYNNELYASGNFYFAALNTSCIARWNDTTWNEVGTGGIPGVVYALGTFNNELYAGGPYFTQAGGVPVNEIAKWNGTTWSAVGSGISYYDGYLGDLFAMKEYHNELYVGGEFSVMDGDSIKSIAKYNGIAWNSVGSGIDSALIVTDTLYYFSDTIFFYAPHTVSAFIEFNNDLYVGGTFNMIGGVAAHSIAKWSTPVGIQEPAASNSIVVFPNPTANKIFIDCYEQNSFYELHDLSGKLLLRDNISTKKFAIDLQDFESGIYILSVYNKQKQSHLKIIRQ
jgi:hypothetical protein